MNYKTRQKLAQQRHKATAMRRRLRLFTAAAVVMFTGAFAAPASAPTMFKVRPGDTFSGIAARLTGSARDWNKLYDPQRSQLPDANRIMPGMRLQLVAEPDGTRYLRAATPTQVAEARALAKQRRLAAQTPEAKTAASKPVLPDVTATVKPPMPSVASPRAALPTTSKQAVLPAPALPVIVTTAKPAAPAAVPLPTPTVLAQSPSLQSSPTAVARPMAMPSPLSGPVPVPVPVPMPTAALTPTPAPQLAQLPQVPVATVPSPAAAKPAPVPAATPAVQAAAGVTTAAVPKAPAAIGPSTVPVPLPPGLTAAAPTAANTPVATSAKAVGALAAAAVVAPVSAQLTAKIPGDTSPSLAASDTLVIGVMPNINGTVLMAQYDNLKSYLERTTAQKVRIVVPASLKAYFEATLRGDYDLAVGAPHFARLAQADARMQPVAMYEPRANAQLVTLVDGTMKSNSDLRGKAVVFANPQSLVAMYGRQWLSQQKLEQGRDYDVKTARTDLGVGRMLLSGDAVAAVMSSGEFRALPADEAARLKIVEVIARVPNFVIVAHPRLGSERIAKLKAKLQGFLADKTEGVAFAKATGISGIVDADEGTLRELDPFVAATRRMMVPAP
jgi:phosphonate transport system substrate-binding protein